MFRKKMLFVILLSFVIGINAQEDENKLSGILKKTESFYNNDSFKVNLLYKMYGNYIINKPFEKYSSEYYRNKNNIYLKIHNTETICNYPDKKIIKVYSDQKVIEVYPLKEESLQSPVSIFKYLEFFPTRQIEKKNLTYKITLIASEITQLPFGKVELFIDMKTYQLKKQVVYYLNAVNYKNDEGEKLKGNPRLETIFSNYSTETDAGLEKKLDINYYFSSSNQLKNIYKDYKLITY